ncbi:MAG: hypothetical protein AABW72_01405 [archaeon]
MLRKLIAPRILHVARLKHLAHLQKKLVEAAKKAGLPSAKLKKGRQNMRDLFRLGRAGSRGLTLDEKKQVRNARDGMYARTPWGKKIKKVAKQRYMQTPLGKAAKKRDYTRPEAKAARARYRQSEKGQITFAKIAVKYRRSGKQAKTTARYRGRIVLQKVLSRELPANQKNLGKILEAVFPEKAAQGILSHIGYFNEPALLKIFSAINESQILQRPRLFQADLEFIEGTLGNLARSEKNQMIADTYRLMNTAIQRRAKQLHP